MKIYTVEVEFLNHKTGEPIFNKIAGMCYKTLDQAIQFVRSHSDYKYEVNSYLHVGAFHRWTIRSVTLL